MGTDIHLYVELKTDGVWHRVCLPSRVCAWCRGKPSDRECYNCGGTGQSTQEYDNRNYDLFAMLAGVRNGVGFAGVDTGDGFVPLAEPRGMPEDMSVELKREEMLPGDKYPPNLGDHSYSYATLAEVLEYDYTRTTKKRGVVGAIEYDLWVKRGRKGSPSAWCGGVSGMSVRNVTNDEMDKLIAQGEAGPDRQKKPNELSYHTQIMWETSYRESAGKDWFAFLESCKTLGDPTQIRLVFGFDS